MSWKIARFSRSDRSSAAAILRTAGVGGTRNGAAQRDAAADADADAADDDDDADADDDKDDDDAALTRGCLRGCSAPLEGVV